MSESNNPQPLWPEPYVNFKTAAERFGVQPYKVARAARLGLFPTYTFYNSRKLVRLSEVAAAFQEVTRG
jgi:hypothetical protein